MPELRVLIAPDSLKGSATATQAARAIARGWSSVRGADHLTLLPFADGGEGTLDAVSTATPEAVMHSVTVSGPVGEPVTASWLMRSGGHALVELASSSGLLKLHTPQPLDAHTAGVGEVIRDAIAHGATRVTVAIGGSASTDGGVGLLTSLGVRFLDAHGRVVRPGARTLHDIRQVDRSGLIDLPVDGITVWSDVTNPLLGARGAAAVYGPQKGLTPEQVAFADHGLGVLAAVLGADPDAPGAGAAGGAGYGLMWLGASMRGGAQAVAETIQLADHLPGADLIITGEGSFDAQSRHGKAVSLVAHLAAEHGVPVALIAGVIDTEAETEMFEHVYSLAGLADAGIDPMRDAGELLERAAQKLATSLSKDQAPR